jgi:hypothetical protein
MEQTTIVAAATSKERIFRCEMATPLDLDETAA